jgi:hypothetical protein
MSNDEKKKNKLRKMMQTSLNPLSLRPESIDQK